MSTISKGYVVILNADNTEGRGPLYPGPVCVLRETAERLAERAGVQGSPANIEECDIISDGRWSYGPVKITDPSAEDIRKSAEREKAQLLEEKRILVLEKAKELGLTEEEIKLLSTP